MRTRSWKAGLGTGLVTLALITAACGDSGDDSRTSSDKKNDTSKKLASADCGSLEYDKDAPKGGTYTDYAWLSDSGTNTTFDPGAVQSLSESQITTALFDGLTDFDFTEKCASELKGAVAESFEPNEDATVWTFQLKEDQKFSNGDPVLPSDFKRGWERAGSAELASAYGYLINFVKGGADYNAGEGADTLDAIEADDEAMTLTVTLESANADFGAIVTHPFFSPITKAEADKVGNKTGWGTEGVTVGNGPFKLDKADEAEVVLSPNEEWTGNVYGDTEVNLDKLVFKATIDVDTAYQAFESGEGDSAPVPPGKYSAAQSKYKNNTVDDPNLGAYYFDFGFEDSQVGGDENLKLRQAISLAIDREEINEKVYENTRTIATGITPPGIPGFKENLCEFCKTDTAKAKTLFDEWTADGGKLTEPIKLNFNEGGGHDKVSQVIQANLKATLGIESELAPVADDYFKEVVKPGGCEMCRSGWYADYPTYGNFMVDLFSKASIDGNNFGRFDNEKFEGLIADAQAETDPAKRGELYNQAEEVLLNEEVAAIPLNWYTGSQVYRDRVINADQPPLGIMLWERIAVEGS